ncbi:HNH/ENDO VII family nuclease, partial [Pseudomonas urmiensis]|uniref:HNH/ENDO VII family nuclease n=1 Tax=Pseudomonas urmiensis TaxID=2745493 RepID=UPI003C96FCF7
LSDISEFIEQNPDKAQTVAVVLALTQGPKGVIQAVAMSAAEQTPLGQELMARLQGMQEYVGQKIAEHMEGQGLKKDDSFDQYLMGGGSLVASIIGTGISAVKGGKAGADGPSREVKTGAERGNGGAKATASLEKEAGTYFGQQRKYWSQEPIQYNGNKVYQRNDLIDPGRVDSQTGLTNKQLMENGLAPYGTDGKKINLHHMLQTQDGPIAEVTQSFHQKNTAVIHINSGSDISSGINRAQFEKWKKGYWKARASDF